MLVDQVRPAVRDWARACVRRIGARVAQVQTRRRRKFLIVHLDGVPRGLVDEAVASGRAPFLSRLVRSGAYQLESAFWGSPASTPCFQAGLLYGLRHPNLPAYHWYERELGRIVRMNVPKDTCAIEGRLKGKDAGLLDGGTSYLSLFSGHASNQLCMSALADLTRMGKALAHDMRGIREVERQKPWSFLQELVRDTCQAGGDVFRWVERLRDSRHEREYMLNRFFLISLAWGLAHSRALIDMVRGVPAIYLVFGNYDEVAHRRGPRSRQATDELYRIDPLLEQLYAFAKAVDEPYDVIFLSDHGHVDSAPIEQRSGKRLERWLFDGPPVSLPGNVSAALVDGRQFTPDSPVQFRDEPVVIEAGNFAHVYLHRGKRPLEAMEILARHSEPLARVVGLSDVGIAALRRGNSAVAIIQGEVYSPDEVQRSPLSSGFSKRAVADLLRELPHMQSAGDLVLYGDAVGHGGTVGFAWEFGSHGGLTNIETDSVICWPTDAPVKLGGLGHVTQLHEKLSEAYR